MLGLALMDAPDSVRDEGMPDSIIPDLPVHRDDFNWRACDDHFLTRNVTLVRSGHRGSRHAPSIRYERQREPRRVVYR